nr:protein kinase-like domain-containing protein [Tanacetum cinerariifolium]
DLVGGLTDSKYEEINVPIKMGVDCSITAKDLVVGDILAKYGSDVCNASNSFTFPAQGNERFLKVSCNELLKATDGFSTANLIGKGGFSSIYKGILNSDKKHNSQQSQSSGNERFLKVSYNELLKATDGFSTANLIGEGGFSSIYKGILNSDMLLMMTQLCCKVRRLMQRKWKNVWLQVAVLEYPPLWIPVQRTKIEIVVNELQRILNVLQNTKGLSSCLYGKAESNCKKELCMS